MSVKVWLSICPEQSSRTERMATEADRSKSSRESRTDKTDDGFKCGLGFCSVLFCSGLSPEELEGVHFQEKENKMTSIK